MRITVALIYLALMPNASAQAADTTQAVVTTIFMGDLSKSQSFMDILSDRYERFLNHWVRGEYCTQSPWGDEAARGCQEAHEAELREISDARWSRHFRLDQAEFNRYLEDKNIGTYNFVREIFVLPEYRCRFTMQITAILNAPEFRVSREFFPTCEKITHQRGKTKILSGGSPFPI